MLVVSGRIFSLPPVARGEAAALCGKKAGASPTWLQCVCSTPASSSPPSPSQSSPSRLLGSSNHHPSLCHHHISLPVVATMQLQFLFFFLLCCMPASLYLPPYLPVSVLFFSISVSTRFPSLSTSLSHLFSPPPCAPATLHPASLHPALLPFLSLSLLPARAHMTHTG